MFLEIFCKISFVMFLDPGVVLNIHCDHVQYYNLCLRIHVFCSSEMADEFSLGTESTSSVVVHTGTTNSLITPVTTLKCS